jgi:hypothetical protein
MSSSGGGQRTANPIRTPNPVTSDAPSTSGSASFAVFEGVMLIVCILSWLLMNRRKEQLAVRQQQRYRRLAAAGAGGGGATGGAPSSSSVSRPTANSSSNERVPLMRVDKDDDVGGPMTKEMQPKSSMPTPPAGIVNTPLSIPRGVPAGHNRTGSQAWAQDNSTWGPSGSEPPPTRTPVSTPSSSSAPTFGKV